MITVYYDSRCGLCTREINHYKSVAPEGIFVWKDAIDYAHELAEEGISTTDALMAMHAKDKEGNLHKGVDTFILIWSQLKHWKLLAWIMKLPGIHALAGVGYHTFAKWKFKRSAHCQLVADDKP